MPVGSRPLGVDDGAVSSWRSQLLAVVLGASRAALAACTKTKASITP